MTIIRARRSAGEQLASIAADFAVHPATISRIARRVWRQEVA